MSPNSAHLSRKVARLSPFYAQDAIFVAQLRTSSSGCRRWTKPSPRAPAQTRVVRRHRHAASLGSPIRYLAYLGIFIHRTEIEG